MKKVFNLTVMLAALMTAVMFSSCGSDEDAATITIDFNQGGKFVTGETVTATITSKEEKLTSIELWKGTSKDKNLTIPDAKDGVYTLNITGLADGSYTLKVASKTGATEGSFTIAPPADIWEGAANQIVVETNKSYLCKQDGVEYTIEIVSATKDAITLKLDNGSSVELGDAATLKSFISQSGVAMSQPDANTNAGSVLFAKLSGSSVLTTATANIANPIAGAKLTVFIAAD